MTTQPIETLIIGAGQAGLSTGYHLKQRGREFLIVDGNDRIGWLAGLHDVALGIGMLGLLVLMFGIGLAVLVGLAIATRRLRSLKPASSAD